MNHNTAYLWYTILHYNAPRPTLASTTWSHVCSSFHFLSMLIMTQLHVLSISILTTGYHICAALLTLRTTLISIVLVMSLICVLLVNIGWFYRQRASTWYDNWVWCVWSQAYDHPYNCLRDTCKIHCTFCYIHFFWTTSQKFTLGGRTYSPWNHTVSCVSCAILHLLRKGQPFGSIARMEI